MIKTRLTELVGIKYPIIQAGMGPYPVTNLCIAASNAGCLGLCSTAYAPEGVHAYRYSFRHASRATSLMEGGSIRMRMKRIPKQALMNSERHSLSFTLPCTASDTDSVRGAR